MRKHDSAADIGQRINDVRKKLRVSQKDMAAGLQIAPSYLCEIEKGNGNPGPELFVRLASEYNVNLNYLFMGKGDMFGDTPLKIKKQEFDIYDDIDTLEKINWLYEKSVIFRGVLTSQANKILYQEREMIEKSLHKDKSKNDDKSE
jgi:transcriptional regulator with XRE-family HTH domain